MYIINIFDPKEWDIAFDCTPYKTTPKKGQSLKAWSMESNATLTFNLCFFNMPTTANKQKGIAYNTIQYLQIAKLGGDVAYGKNDNDKLIIPNNDKVVGWKTAIKNGVVVSKDTATKRSRNMIGVLEDGRFISVQTSKGYTEKSVAVYVNSYVPTRYGSKVKLLLIMDAGGSTGCYSNASKLLFAPEKEGTNGRSVASVVNFTRKPTARKVTSPITKYSNKEDIKLLQQVIGGVEVDGNFGSMTTNRLISAQKALKITANGKADMTTLKALGIA